MVNSDKDSSLPSRKARRASAHHSAISEHFEGNYPIFLNRWEEGFELREHDHAYLELVYVMFGEGYHYVGDAIEHATKGSLYILPVGTSHILRPKGTSSDNKLLVYNLCIRSEFISEFGEWLSRYGIDTEILFLFTGSPGTHISLKDFCMELEYLFEHMFREFTERKQGYETSIFSSLLDLFVKISRQLNVGVNGERLQQQNSRMNLTAILDYIDTHITESLTVQEMAHQANLSRRHYIRLFQQLTGMSFTKYIQMRRIEYACKLLAQSNDKITHIAKHTGYRDTAHFRAIFRKHMGMSPREYRTNS